MKKQYSKLTKEQVHRKVIFSSQLDSEALDAAGSLHEVFSYDDNKDLKIKRLLDDSFFDGSPYNVNRIETLTGKA